MPSHLRRLFLGAALIILASAALLFSDLSGRTQSERTIPHVGLLQHASVVLVDDIVRGMVDSLAENGCSDGRRLLSRNITPKATSRLRIRSPRRWSVLGSICCWRPVPCRFRR